MQKTITTLAIAGSIALLGASSAQALYPAPAAPVVGSIVDNDGVIIAGETITFGGGGFIAFGDINITIVYNGTAPEAAGGGAGRVAAAPSGLIVLSQVLSTSTVKADAAGNFAAPVELEEAGVYTLTGTGVDPDGAPRTVVSTVTVQAAASAPIGGGTTADSYTKGGLANTGIDSAMLLWGAAGIGALGLGAGSIVVARRRTEA